MVNTRHVNREIEVQDASIEEVVGNRREQVEEVQVGGMAHGEAPDMTQFVRDIATAVVEASRGIAGNREHAGNRLSDALREFIRMNPPKFSGEVDPIAANHWLTEVTKIFDMLEIVESKIRISLASFQLVGEASEWWTTVTNG